MHTTEQTRAQIAFRKVSAANVSDEKFTKKYSTQCRRLPALIHQCGFCQAVAFLQAKSGDTDRDAIRHFLDDFAAAVLHDKTDKSSAHLGQLARTSQFADYQWLSRPGLATATW